MRQVSLSRSFFYFIIRGEKTASKGCSYKLGFILYKIRRMNYKGGIMPCVKVLSKDINEPIFTVNRALSDLKKLGVVKREKVISIRFASDPIKIRLNPNINSLRDFKAFIIKKRLSFKLSQQNIKIETAKKELSNCKYPQSFREKDTPIMKHLFTQFMDKLYDFHMATYETMASWCGMSKAVIHEVISYMESIGLLRKDTIFKRADNGKFKHA